MGRRTTEEGAEREEGAEGMTRTTLQHELLQYNNACMKIQELLGIQGMRRDVKESQKEYWIGVQLHAQAALAAALSALCANGAALAAALLPAVDQLTSNSLRKEALQTIRKLMITGEIVLQENFKLKE